MRQLLLSCFVVFLVLGTLRINYYVSSFSLFPTSSTCPASRALGLNRHGKSKTTNLFSSSWQDGIRRLFFSQEGTIKREQGIENYPDQQHVHNRDGSSFGSSGVRQGKQQHTKIAEIQHDNQRRILLFLCLQRRCNGGLYNHYRTVALDGTKDGAVSTLDDDE